MQIIFICVYIQMYSGIQRTVVKVNMHTPLKFLMDTHNIPHLVCCVKGVTFLRPIICCIYVEFPGCIGISWMYNCQLISVCSYLVKN